MEIGSIAEWVSAFAGILAAIATMVITVKAFNFERDNSRKILEQQRREQASKICVMGAVKTENDEENWCLYIRNDSSQYIRDICIKSQHLGTQQPNHPYVLAALPPGEYLVPSHPKFHWGSPIDLSRNTDESYVLTLRGKGGKMVTCVTFQDVNGIYWRIQDQRLDIIDPPTQSCDSL